MPLLISILKGYLGLGLKILFVISYIRVIGITKHIITKFHSIFLRHEVSMRAWEYKRIDKSIKKAKQEHMFNISVTFL